MWLLKPDKWSTSHTRGSGKLRKLERGGGGVGGGGVGGGSVLQNVSRETNFVFYIVYQQCHETFRCLEGNQPRVPVHEME